MAYSGAANRSSRFAGKALGGQAGSSVRPARRIHDVARLMAAQPWDRVSLLLEQSGASPAIALPRMRRFTELLLEWNRGYSNLISNKDESRVVSRHVLESLEPAHWLKASGASRWIDFGSGGGLPAIPLAVAGVGESWSLVESRRNKTLFLRKVIQEIGLTGVNVELARLESLANESARLGLFDAFTSRATLRLCPTLAEAARWISPGGWAFLWKGSRLDKEMSDDRAWERFWEPAGTLQVGSGPSLVARFSRKT